MLVRRLFLGWEKTNRGSNLPDRSSAFRVIVAQSFVVFVVSLIWGWQSFQAMAQVLFGGAVFIVPNALFAYCFFAKGRAHQDPRSVVNAFYKYELIKLVFMVSLVVVIFVELSVMIAPFLAGLIGACFSMLFAPLLSLRSRGSKAAWL